MILSGETLNFRNSTISNEAVRDFSQASTRQSIEAAVRAVQAQFPIAVPAMIAGEAIEVGQQTSVTSPNRIAQIVSRYWQGTTELATRAVEACGPAAQSWSRWDALKRVEIIEKAAQLMRAERDSLVALMMWEVGKDPREAEADLAEAIDFCVYYAQEMRRLSAFRETMKIPGEVNLYGYRPRGLTVTISPWNFPLAILCGMTVAPLVAGNPVIMKPAEQSNAIALRLYQILRGAGVPAEALQLVPGQGEVVGAALAASPQVHVINFTGSKAVGLHLIREAADIKPGQKHIKRVLAEMGGKNAVVVDEDADLDEAVIHCLHSAFGFQGQKCSALSRILIHKSLYLKFKSRFIEALHAWKIGPAVDPQFKIGPVIDQESQRRLMAVIERNRKSIVFQAAVDSATLESGCFVPPTVFESRDFDSELGRDEFFGPLVCLFEVENFEDGIGRANGVDYALTGGVFTRSPQNIAYAKANLEVGNMYINRGITGALVCRQPFGGFKLSGVGAKAGGSDYLLQFLEPQTITENTMRRGFAPTE